MKKSILIFLILLCISNLVFAQNKTKLDSLTLLLKDSKKDSTRVIILNQLWRYTLYNNTENSIKYANDMISFSKSINYPKGIGVGHQNLGVIASQNSDYETAKDEFKKALSVYKTNKLKKEEAFVSSQIATDFFYQGKYDSAIYYNALSREKFFNYRDTLRAGSTYVLESAIYLEKSYFKLALTAGIKAAKIFSKHNDILGYARATYNNACVLESLDRDNEAISNYQEIITIFEEHEDYYNLALTYQGLGMSYSKLKQNKNDAISNFKKSIDYAKKLNDSVLIATSLNELGKLHLTYNELDIAENLLNESYVISTKIDSKFSKHIAAIDIGDLYHLKKEYAQSIKYYKEGISLSTEIGVLLGMSNANKGLYTVYKSLNKPSEALKYHEIYMTLHDSIYNINQTEKINELQIQYETQKKEAEIVFQQQEIKNLNQEVEISNLRKGLYAGGMFTFLVVSGLLLFSFKQRIKKNKIAHEKQEEIYRQEIAFKKKELASQTLHLVQKNTFIQELRENLEKIKKSPELFKVEFRRLVMLLKKESAEDKDWEVFKSYFSEVHNNFDNKLKEVSIDISEKEIRLASFLRMNLSTKEIASMLNVLPESVLKSKYRLKKKLDLDKETDLNQFLNSL